VTGAAGPLQISAVIPTRKRPDLLLTAVRSALAQSLAPAEVIVVIDGPSPETQEVLAGVGDARLRVVQLDTRHGGAAARNAGIAAATSPWIALLDDDDEWAPEKLERQAALALACTDVAPVIACRTWYRSPTATFVLPRRLPDDGEDIGEYLLTRRSLFQGEGLVQTSMLLAPRALFRSIPFRPDLGRHHEWDWLLRADREAGAVLHFVDEPLSVWNAEEERTSISAGRDWKPSLEWAEEIRPMLTTRAYMGFILTFVASLASRARDRRAVLPLLRRASAAGRPPLRDLAIFAGLWLVPPAVRLRIRQLLLDPARRGLSRNAAGGRSPCEEASGSGARHG
jgi:glycosyltransferase involved in cell wall biosynthesis